MNAPSQIETDQEREVRAGITEYICPDNLGFTGILKQRYTDFLVNEIGLDGQVLHLKSTQVAKKKKQEEGEKKEKSIVEAPVEEVKEEKIEIREENGRDAALVASQEKTKLADKAEQPAKTEEANDGEETFTIGGAPKKEDKEEVRR